MHVIVDGVVYARQGRRGIDIYFDRALTGTAGHPRRASTCPCPACRRRQPSGSPVSLVPRDMIQVSHRTGRSWRVAQKPAQLVDLPRLRIGGHSANTTHSRA